MSEIATILIIGPTPPPFHGVAVAVQTLLRSKLAEQFHVCHLDLADRRGIQHVNKPDLYDVVLFCRQWVQLIGMLFRKRTTVTYLVLSQSTVGFLRDSLLVWPSFLGGSRIVIHLHGGNFHDWYLGRFWIMKAYVRAVLSRVTRAIVLGDSLRSQFDGLVKQDRIAVVANGIDWKDSKKMRILPDNTFCFRILHLSTLSHLKGSLVLVSAIPHVITKRRDVEFILAGPWSHAEDQEWADRFIQQQGIGEHIRFTGQVDGDEKKALFESADVFVFPGVQQEGQPLVVLEAMAAGLPVIFTDRGCLRDTVVNGETGLETLINDPHQLADHILWLLDHPDEMKSMGKHARQRYEAHYTKNRHIENMIEVFDSACANSPL
jgi:glycosyltransferase involved in cell wall biosynthesis